MNHLVKFLKATLVGGLLVLFPLIGTVYFIVFVGKFLIGIIEPFMQFLPGDSNAGLPLAEIGSLLILILLCFLVGIFIRTRPGLALASRISQALDRIPTYRMLRRIAEILFDAEDPRGTPVIVNLGDAKEIGFMVEQHGTEGITVFFPSAPTLLGGSIKIVSPDKVEKLNVKTGAVARAIGSFGAGTNALLAGRKTLDDPSAPIDPPE